MKQTKRPRRFEHCIRHNGPPVRWMAFYKAPNRYVHTTEGLPITSPLDLEGTYWFDGILVTHGSPNGFLEGERFAKRANLIVCCYPGAVRKAHPNLPILGDWDVKTWTVLLTTDEDGNPIAPILAIGREIERK